MNFKEIAGLWSEYQNWLKQENITVDNIQSKLPGFIQQLQANPENAEKLRSVLNSPQARQIMKMMKLSDDEIATLTSVANGNAGSNNVSNGIVGTPITPIATQVSNRIGNLTPEQLAKLVKKR